MVGYHIVVIFTINVILYEILNCCMEDFTLHIKTTVIQRRLKLCYIMWYKNDNYILYIIQFQLDAILFAFLIVVITPVFPVVFLLIFFIYSFIIFGWSTLKLEIGFHVVILCPFHSTFIFYTPSTVLSLIRFYISKISSTSFFFPFPVPFCFALSFLSVFSFTSFLLFLLPFLLCVALIVLICWSPTSFFFPFSLPFCVTLLFLPATTGSFSIFSLVFFSFLYINWGKIFLPINILAFLYSFVLPR